MSIDKYEDVIDSREVIERIEELQEQANEGRYVVGWNMPGYMPDNTPEEFDSWEDARDYIVSELVAEQDDEDPGAYQEIQNAIDALNAMDEGEQYAGTVHGSEWFLTDTGTKLDKDEQEELNALLSLQEDASGSPDWEYGETLIHDSYFKEYAQELANDCGMIPDDLKWPMTCIDWEQAARELQMDYFSVKYMGQTFWIRA